VNDDGRYLNTLGVAQYRAGKYAAALATLTRSNEINRNREAGDPAFLAMTQHRVGQAAAARATLDRLRAVMKTPAVATDSESQAFLREAEALILRLPAELPEDVFAR
jgi:hypothetical protein